MGTAALAHLRYDLDRYILEFRRVSNLASVFIIKDPIVKQEYLREVESYINSITIEYDSVIDPYVKVGIINRLKEQVTLTNKEYSILRTKDYITYVVTDIFEDQGVIKYANISVGVLSGGIQVWAGAKINSLGKKLNLKRLRGLGLLMISHGGSNIYESLSPIIYEHKDAGPVRELYRMISKSLGGGDSEGDFAYSTVDFSLAIYAAFRMPTLIQSPNRLINKGFLEQPGTGMLFRNVNKDYAAKFSAMNNTMRIFHVGVKGYQFYSEFVDEGYSFDGSK